MSTKPRILLFNPVKHALAKYEELQESTAPEPVTSASRAEFFEDCQSKYNGVAAIYRTSASGAVSNSYHRHRSSENTTADNYRSLESSMLN